MSTSATQALGAGRAWPLGATCDGAGVNFAVFSQHAEGIELCLFDELGEAEVARWPLASRSDDIWHGHLHAAGPGLVYGLRAHGPWQPAQGQRFNAHKLLLDPYAREIVGDFEWRDEQFGFTVGNAQRIDTRDNARHALKARVIDDGFDWGDDKPPATSAADSVIYELHVRSFTMQHPDVPASARGSFAGLASDAALEHLRKLGVTAVCLLPIHHFLDEQRLVGMGLRNHWGYNTLGFFSPQPRYGSAGNGLALRDEFRHMVRRLHDAGIEVILDVVYNHTAETDAAGPTLSWRGLDNAAYYRLEPGRANAYVNHAGCGNTLNLQHVRVQQMVLDSLRYWVQQMHVDGFRFDLATVLGRTDGPFDTQAPFFTRLMHDPVLAGVKLIAEPWDVGPGGYQLGGFPNGWLEWNDRFRDTTRAFWLGGRTTRGEFAHRLCGSAREFQTRHRAPSASVNYVVSHDGFSLLDLVSYARRHNEANGEDNRDGDGNNLSWNCGAEGPTDDSTVLRRRSLLQRAMLATTVLAQGTPMLTAGAELGHSQGGNNNAYCQDNPISWIDWRNADLELTAFAARLIGLRRELRPFGDAWADGETLRWFVPDGRAPSVDEWDDDAARALGLHVTGSTGKARSLLMLFNAGQEALSFVLPAGGWHHRFDSSCPGGVPADEAGEVTQRLQVGAHRLLLLGDAVATSLAPESR